MILTRQGKYKILMFKKQIGGKVEYFSILGTLSTNFGDERGGQAASSN